MRDYKNVKVPRSYRSGAKGSSVKRVQAGGSFAQPRKGRAGFTGALKTVVAVMVIAAVAYFGRQAYQSIMHGQMFVVSGVDIKGVKQLSEGDLNELAKVFTGQNIFRVDIEAAARRAQANPWIKEARIYRKLPNRITMAFIERSPAAILDTGVARYLVDDEAVVIGRLSQEPGPEWPLPVVAIKNYRGRPGEQVTSEGMAEAMTLIAEIAARGGWQLAEVTVEANSPESLSVVYAGHEFKIGSGRYGEKLRRLAEVMADAKERGLEIAYVDLRPERQAAVMVVNNKKVRN